MDGISSIELQGDALRPLVLFVQPSQAEAKAADPARAVEEVAPDVVAFAAVAQSLRNQLV